MNAELEPRPASTEKRDQVQGKNRPSPVTLLTVPEGQPLRGLTGHTKQGEGAAGCRVHKVLSREAGLQDTEVALEEVLLVLGGHVGLLRHSLQEDGDPGRTECVAGIGVRHGAAAWGWVLGPDTVKTPPAERAELLAGCVCALGCSPVGRVEGTGTQEHS